MERTPILENSGAYFFHRRKLRGNAAGTSRSRDRPLDSAVANQLVDKVTPRMIGRIQRLCFSLKDVP